MACSSMIYSSFLVTAITVSINKAHQFFTDTRIFELGKARYNLGCVTLRGKEMGDGGATKMLFSQDTGLADASAIVGCAS